MFKSIDEIDKFSYEDCVLTGMEWAEDGLLFEVEALIVRENNSQNSNFTESYAGPAVIKLADGRITDVIRTGFKYYDAESPLVWESLFKTFPGNYLPSLEAVDGGYIIEIEMSEEDGTQGNSYLLKIEASSVIVTWDKYLNRVGR